MLFFGVITKNIHICIYICRFKKRRGLLERNAMICCMALISVMALILMLQQQLDNISEVDGSTFLKRIPCLNSICSASHLQTPSTQNQEEQSINIGLLGVEPAVFQHMPGVRLKKRKLYNVHPRKWCEVQKHQQEITFILPKYLGGTP